MFLVLLPLIFTLGLTADIITENPSIPFWKERADIYERITRNRLIIVNAKITKQEGNENKSEKLEIISAGHISSPLHYSLEKIMAFEDYDQMTNHFKDIVHNKEDKDLQIKVGAFNYYANLWIKYDIKLKNKNKYFIDWKCYRGSFKGMKGRLVLERYNRTTTEISMHSSFVSEKMPIPDFLIKIGLEIIGRQMAARMRTFIETSYKRTDN